MDGLKKTQRAGLWYSFRWKHNKTKDGTGVNFHFNNISELRILFEPCGMIHVSIGQHPNPSSPIRTDLFFFGIKYLNSGFPAIGPQIRVTWNKREVGPGKMAFGREPRWHVWVETR